MKLVYPHRKPISIFVMFTFSILFCLWANQAPSAPAADKNSGTTLEQGESGSPNFIEKEGDSVALVKKPKKFPWLLVGAVVVVGAAALYFLVLKKTKYELTVNLGAGTTGTPATGKYKKGEVIPYSFSAQTGFINLQVMLDGAAVEHIGNVTMDKSHTITTSATQGASLQVNSTPAGAMIYLDKVDSGQVTPYTFNYSASTTKAVLLRYQCGYQEWTQKVTANLGQEIILNPNLNAGINENFDIPASACWLPRNASAWSVSNGGLKVTDATQGYEFTVYNHSFPTDFTVIVKHKLEQSKSSGTLSVLLSTGADMSNCKGYEFSYNAQRSYAVWNNNGYNLLTYTGPYSAIRGWTKSNSLNPGTGVWNIIKIIKAGSNYSLFINDKSVFSFVKTNWDPRYISLGVLYAGMKVHYDSVLLTAGSTNDSIPGLPVNDIPATTEKWSSDL